jgi:hypothetical protein
MAFKPSKERVLSRISPTEESKVKEWVIRFSKKYINSRNN